jgi:hypothetical protein
LFAEEKDHPSSVGWRVATTFSGLYHFIIHMGDAKVSKLGFYLIFRPQVDQIPDLS